MNALEPAKLSVEAQAALRFFNDTYVAPKDAEFELVTVTLEMAYKDDDDRKNLRDLVGKITDPAEHQTLMEFIRDQGCAYIFEIAEDSADIPSS